TQHARTLIAQYRLEGGLHRLRLRPGSSFVGARRGSLDLAPHGLALIGVQSGEQVEPGADHVLAAGDVLVVRGSTDAVSRLVLRDRLSVGAVPHAGGRDAATLFSRELGVTEIVVPPRSPLEGFRVLPGALTP